LKIVIGCDEAAYHLKEKVKEFLISLNHCVIDKGVYDETPCLYPDIAVSAALEIINGVAERGILMCGTGIGMSISANKVPGIRAAVCHDPFSTERSRKSNNAQIMCLGSRVIAPHLALHLVRLWLDCEFEGGGSAAKVEKIMEYERTFANKEAPDNAKDI